MSKPKSINDAINEEIKYLTGRADGTIKSMKTPWPSLNAAGIEGLEWGTVNTFAAMSGVGKSAFANELVFSSFECNPDDDIAVLFFTVEMAAHRLVGRRLSHDLSIPYKEIHKSGTEVLSKVKNGLLDKYREQDIKYIEQMYTPKKIVQISKQFCKNRLDKKCLIVYDHSLLIRRGPKQTERDALIELANEFNMSKKVFPNSMYIIISQLNRSIESPERIRVSTLHFPKKSDIFGSDALYQASDIVLVLHDPARLNIQKYGVHGRPTNGFIFGHLLKVREGKPGVFVLRNNAHINKFPELTNAEKIQYGFKTKRTK